MVEAQTTPIQPRKVMEWDPITMEITECTAATVMKRMVFRRGHPPKQDQQRLYIYIYIQETSGRLRYVEVCVVVDSIQRETFKRMPLPLVS